jgi:hypothetical protein
MTCVQPHGGLSVKRFVAIGLAAVGGVIVFRSLPREPRSRLTAPVKRWLTEHMHRMMSTLPEDAPPKLVMSILPKLRAQNDQIIALLQEQNELLRQQYRRVAAR